jgi:hypothetical protein
VVAAAEQEQQQPLGQVLGPALELVLPHSTPEPRPAMHQAPQRLGSQPAQPQGPLTRRRQAQRTMPVQAPNSCIRSKLGSQQELSLLQKPGIYYAWGVSIERFRLKAIYRID